MIIGDKVSPGDETEFHKIIIEYKNGNKLQFFADEVKMSLDQDIDQSQLNGVYTKGDIRGYTKGDIHLSIEAGRKEQIFVPVEV